MKNTVGKNDPAALLRTFKRRIAREGWIKSILCGLAVGFGAEILCSLIFWALGIKLFWISIIAFAVVAGASAPLFYFFRFRRSTREVASRVDMLGLEERILTMTQFADDDSFMARYQREDALRALEKANASLIKIAVSVPLIVVCSALLLVGAATTTASAVSDKSLIKLFKEATAEPVVFHTINYGVKDNIGGKIYGRLDQKVENGTAADAVQAVADDNYIFVGWTDGYEGAIRNDSAVEKDFTVNAIFVAIEEDDQNDEEMPDDNSDGDGNGPPSMPNEGPTNGEPSDPGDGEGDGESGAGGATNPSNQVIDGATFFGSEYGNSLSNAQDAVNSGTNLSGDQSGVIGDYFGNIAK